jgi:hypothetical protein
VIWSLSTFIFNIPVILSPLTPAISGRVINAETKQPVANCNIKAYWQIESGTPQGGHWETYHQIITKTDEKGEFQVPRYMKALGLYGLFPIIMSHYGGIKIIAYTHGFKYGLTKIERSQSGPAIIEPSQPTSINRTILMEKSRPPDLTYDIFNLDRIFELNNQPRGKTSEDNKYLLDDYHYYYDRMHTIFNTSNTKDVKSAYIVFASAFERFGDKKTAIDAYQLLKREFPESANFADREIDELKKSAK